MVPSADIQHHDGHHRRSHSSPMQCQERRRVIFPSLHGTSPRFPPQLQHDHISRSNDHPGHEYRGLYPNFSASNLDPNSSASSLDPPCLMRSNSLPKEGAIEEIDTSAIYLPLPKIPLEKQTNKKAPSRKEASSNSKRLIGLKVRDSMFDRSAIGINEDEHSVPISLKSNIPQAQDQIPRSKAQYTAPKKKWVIPPTQALDASSERVAEKSQKSIFGKVTHRTYYPAASVPKYHEPLTSSPGADSKPPPEHKPVRSILRRRSQSSPSSRHSSGRRSGVSASTSSPGSDDGITSTTLHSTPKSLGILPSAPTLASPKCIRSLNNSHDYGDAIGTSRGDEQVVMGETEYTLEHISDAPKVLHRNKDGNSKLRRNSSDTIVAKSEEENRQRQRRASDVKSAGADQCTDEMGSEGSFPIRDDASQKDSLSSRDGSRHQSLECLSCNKNISFDPHITVYEFWASPFEKNPEQKWFTEKELNQFKQEAIQRIRLRSREVIPTGTGRTVAVVREGDNDGRDRTAPPAGSRNGKSVCYSHPALSCDDEFDPDGSSRSQVSRDSLIQDALSREMRNVLVIDPHDIFLRLFTKSLKYMIPHVSVATARSGEEAMSRIHAAQKAFPRRDGGAVHGFDMIIVEERLDPLHTQSLSSGDCNDNTSSGPSTQAAGDDSIQRRRKLTLGSTLIRSIVAEEQEVRKEQGSSNNSARFSLLIGVSAYLAQDRERIKKSGADLTWGKPPPEMNSTLRNELLKTLLEKRKKTNKKLFD